MNPERWRRIEELFSAVSEAEPARGAALLAELAAGDEDLRREVEALLNAHAAAGGFLETNVLEMAAPLLAAGSHELEPGQVFGRYLIVEQIGAGGMGEVYLAEDTQMGRRVALKLLPSSFADDPNFVRRFRQEARAASRLSHPNILIIHEVGQLEGRHFIAAEFVEGVTLRECLAAARMRLGEALAVASQVARALVKAHRNGVVHRDIKPENVMVGEEGHVKVLDFGLAKRLNLPSASSASSASAPVKTSPGVLVGTVAYMSPEQARGLPVDERTDIWSLGVVLYEMIAGRPPFIGETSGDLLADILRGDPPRLSSLSDEATAEVEEVLTKALAKSRDERYATAADFLSDLRRLQLQAEAGDPSKRAAAGGSPAVARTQSAPPAEQRKQITVLFASLADLAARLEGCDEEESCALMDSLRSRLEVVVADGGGHVVRHLGAETMALWGVPGAREDDPERAVRAALRMQVKVGEFVAAQAPRALAVSVDPRANPDAQAGARRFVRIGIGTGTALLRTDGSTGRYEATGAAVNSASRLRTNAPAGHVLIAHDTYRHVCGLFDVREFELPNHTDGPTEDRVYVVERERPRAFRPGTRGVEGVETRMIGRVVELELLTAAMQSVREDRELRIVTVIGDAGLGKSRLLHEFGNAVALPPEPVRVFNGRASQATHGLPFSLLRDLLSFRFDLQDSDTPAVAREKLERGMSGFFGEGREAEMRAHLVGHLAGLDFSTSPHLRGILDDPEQIRDRAFRHVAEFFAAATRERPAALFLDDIHWADDGSLDLLEHLARNCASAPLMILCLARPALLERRPFWGEGQDAHTRITLRSLSKRESRQLVEEILRRAEEVPARLCQMIVAGAEGNPFYVEELIKMLIEQRAILPGEDVWRVDASRLVEVRVPPTLTGVLQARLDGLAAWERTVLQCASVVGRVFWDSAVEHSVGAPVVAGGLAHNALEGLRGKELIYRRDGSSFRGTTEYTFKHVLLRDVTYESVLKREREAYHRAAAEWLIGQSGERASEFAAAIAEHFARAREPARAAEWYGRAGAQAHESYALETAVNYFHKALELMATPPVEAPRGARITSPEAVEWYDGLAGALWKLARYTEAIEAYGAMRAAAESRGDLLAQARAWNGRTLVEERLGDNRAALESARRASELAREAGASAAACAELAAAMNAEGWLAYRRGDAARAVRKGEQALALKHELNQGARNQEAASLRLFGAASLALGHFGDAERYMEEALALFQALGNLNEAQGMLNNLGEVARMRGDHRAAMPHYQKALALARERGNKSEQMVCLSNLSGALIGLGDYAAAEANLRQVIMMAGGGGHFALSETYLFLAEACLGQGRAAEAFEAARRALAEGEETENRDHIGWAWRALGMVASRLGEPVQVGARSCDAGDCFAESLRVFTEIGMEAERARTLREWAHSEQTRGEEPRARLMLAEAREIFSRLGMELEVERTTQPGSAP